MKLFIAFICVCLSFFKVQGATLVETFSSRQVIESNSLVFNQALQSLHPTLRVDNYGDGTQAQDFEVGDGRHGIFDSSTYSNFDQDGDVTGNLIQIDTDIYPALQVTSFFLGTGWTLEAVGSKPLVIQSLTDITINGLIQCRGQNGQDAVGSQPGLGGTARCGGGRGGDGGNVSQDGQDGVSSSTTISGGQGGNFTGGAAVGGGGGGSWNLLSAPGTGSNGSVNGGQAGQSVSDPDFTFRDGSAGGGGGSGTATDAGAGGGAGGGTVLLSAVRNITLGVLGEIDANGGAGGSSNVQGGPGGGGGGGSVRAFAGGEIRLLNPVLAGASRALAGTGGSNALAVATANGGIGRSWFAALLYVPSAGFYFPTEEGVFASGDVTFSSQTQELITKSYDLRSTKWLFQSLTPTHSDVAIEVAGSSDNFDSDDTGWVNDLQQVAGKRYIKLKIKMTNSLGNPPFYLEELVLNYNPANLSEFDFETAGCAQIYKTGAPKSPRGTLLILLFFPIFIILGLKLKSS